KEKAVPIDHRGRGGSESRLRLTAPARRTGPRTPRPCALVLAWLLVVPAFLAASGCSGGRRVPPLRLRHRSLAAPVDARAPPPPESAVRGIAAIMASRFGLPLPGSVTVYVYEGRESFEQGLIQDAGLSSARAAELSEYAIGISGRRLLLLNDDGPNRD